MRRWLTSTIALVLIVVVLALALALQVADRAGAAPLTVKAHPASLYGGRMWIADVRVDVTVKHPRRALVYVNGLARTDDGDWPQLWHVRLHEGRNRLARTFFVRHWERVVPGLVGRPDRWQAEPVTSVYADLTLLGHAGSPLAHARAK